MVCLVCNCVIALIILAQKQATFSGTIFIERTTFRKHFYRICLDFYQYYYYFFKMFWQWKNLHIYF